MPVWFSFGTNSIWWVNFPDLTVISVLMSGPEGWEISPNCTTLNDRFGKICRVAAIRVSHARVNAVSAISAAAQVRFVRSFRVHASCSESHRLSDRLFVLQAAKVSGEPILLKKSLILVRLFELSP